MANLNKKRANKSFQKHAFAKKGDKTSVVVSLMALLLLSFSQVTPMTNQLGIEPEINPSASSLKVNSSIAPTSGKHLATSPTPTPDEQKKAFKAAMVTDLTSLTNNPDKKGYNDLCWQALQKAKEELKINVAVLKSRRAADYESYLTKLASQGYDFIVGCGFLLTDALESVARKYPDIHFAIVDSQVDAPNVQSLVFAEEEGSFLVGAIAAGMSKTGIIGFLGGMDVPLVRKFEAGYMAGAKSINPEIRFISSYTGSFTDREKGRAMSQEQFKQGADVIYSVAWMGGLGNIEAAKKYRFWAIGVDTDQDGYAKGSVLTSMIKHVEIAVYNSVKTAYDGNFKGGIVISDLKIGGVGYSDLRYTRDRIPADLLKRVDELAEMIKNGSLFVPTTMEELSRFVPPIR